MKRDKRRRRARAGETLGEVLIAMLIVALSALMLAGMVSSAGQINLSVRETDESFYKSVSALEKRDGTPKDGTLTVKIETSDSTADAEVAVSVFEEGGMISYKAKEGTP